MTNKLTGSQLTALQTLWSQYARHSLDVSREGDRSERLCWASKNVGRAIASFKDLTQAEAITLIDILRGALGQSPKRQMRRDAARRAGTEGRRNGPNFTTQLASAEDLATIERFYQRLSWTREQFDAWLASPRSPLARKINGQRVVPLTPQIRTSRDANRVRWALKGMLSARGLWEKRNSCI